ncbi:MAG: hypothetical protein ACRD5L_10630, partial [Bryobacteraceae bacterium]
MKPSHAVVGVIAVAVVLAALPGRLSSQWPDYPTARVPRDANGKPILDGPTPKASDGHPDLSGVWQNGRGGVPGGPGRGPGRGAGQGKGGPPQGKGGPPGPGRQGKAGPPPRPVLPPDGIPIAQFQNIGAGFPDGLPLLP